MPSSSKQYMTSSVITSRTLVSGPLPSAIPHTAMSRSVIHADEAVAVGDRQHAAIAFFHHLRRVTQRVVRTRQLGGASHDIADLHSRPPLQRGLASRQWSDRKRRGAAQQWPRSHVEAGLLAFPTRGR